MKSWNNRELWQRGLAVLGVVATLVGLVLALYVEFWRDGGPNLAIQFLSEESVTEVARELPTLDIGWRGHGSDRIESLMKLERQIGRSDGRHIVNLKVVNKGRGALPLGAYDEADPLGVAFRHGEVLEARVTGASSNYLLGRESAGLTIREGILFFPPVILDSTDWSLCSAQWRSRSA